MKTTTISSATIPSITIGIDLEDRKHADYVLNAQGEVIKEKAITDCRESLRHLRASLNTTGT